MTGVMAYLSAPLWFLMLLLSTALLAVHTLIAPEYFVQPYQLFPLWPEWRPERAIALFSATATLLFLPKILSVVLICMNGARRRYGGALRLGLSMFCELLLSMLLAPIRMLFHAQFVAASLSGWGIQWKSPPREDSETTWGEALRRHGWHTLLGVVWAGGVYWLNPSFVWWLLPVAGALIISIPLSVYTSRVSAGRELRDAGYFLIPEEREVPVEIRRMQEEVERSPASPDFNDAIVDPLVNAISCASGVTRFKQSEQVRAERNRLIDAVISRGPDTLTAQQKMILLSDPLALSRLHFHSWTVKTASPWFRGSRPWNTAASRHDAQPQQTASAAAG